MLPDLVLGGAPKCGTSSLFRWLSDHPDVRGSEPKEPGFLVDRGHALFRPECNVHDHGIGGYGTYFPERDGARVLLEATTHYLYQDTARRVLAELPTQPRVVFLLRKPSARVYSSYRYTRENQAVIRPDASFADFLRLREGAPAETVTSRAWSGHVDIWRNDVHYSEYVVHLRRWRDAVGPERMLVLLFEDMAADPGAIVRRVCDFAGIDGTFFGGGYVFGRSNETYQVRNPGLHRLMRRVARGVPGGGRLRQAARASYMTLFTRAKAGSGTPAADAEALARLDRHFAPYNAQLAADFGLDLSRWA